MGQINSEIDQLIENLIEIPYFYSIVPMWIQLSTSRLNTLNSYLCSHIVVMSPLLLPVSRLADMVVVMEIRVVLSSLLEICGQEHYTNVVKILNYNTCISKPYGFDAF